MKTQRYILLAAMLLMHIATVGAVQIITDPPQDLCPGDVINWRSKSITSGGDYADTLRTKLQPKQDSIIYQIHVNELTPEMIYEDTSICANELSKFKWHGMKFTKAGTYYYKEGDCEKVHVLRLKVPQPSKDSTIVQYFCIVEGYNYPYGTVNRKDTTYIEENKNIDGCDSIVTKVFKMLPYVSKFKMLQHEKDSSVTWMGKTYTQDGRYYDYYRGEGGNCDSVWEITVATRYDLFYAVVKCEGQVVKHNGKIIDHNCEVIDTLKTALGADSLLHFNYSFRAPFYHLDTAYICDRDTFVWTNHINPATMEPYKFTTEGLYSDAHSLPGSECDSTYEIFVKVSKRWERDSVVVVCNDSLAVVGCIRWTDSHNITHEFCNPNTDTTIIDVRPKTATFPADTMSKHTGGCDSIFRFRVIITDRCSELEKIPMCRCKGYVYVDDFKYTKPGIYSTRWPSSRGLDVKDSIHRFEIYWEDNDTTIDERVICESELPLRYNDGKLYGSKQSGDYMVRFTNRHGCDSIVKLHITVLPTKYSPYNNFTKFCPGEPISVKIGDTTFTETGDFTYTVPYGTYGCDSVIRIHIATKTAIFKVDSVFLRPGDTYTWKGHKGDIIYSAPGTYHDSIPNADGCYDVYRLCLIEAKSYEIPEMLTVCTLDSAFKWHDKYITKDGVYYDSLKTIYNMDSVYILTVTLHPAYTIHETHTLCYGDFIEIEGIKYYTSGTVNVLKKTPFGCDSMVIHQINVNSATRHVYESMYCAKGQSVTWRERTYDKTGDYADTIRTTTDPNFRCDSIIFHMHLDVIDPYRNERHLDTCANDLAKGFTWRRQFIQQEGEYIDTVGVPPFDSIYKLTVTALPTFETTLHVKICEGSSYNFGTRVLTQPGTYIDHFAAGNGCDSAVTCILNFAPKYYMPEEIGTTTFPVIWHGQTITKEGYYYDSLTTSGYGCDSIYMVHVFKKESYFFSKDTQNCACQLPYQWRGLNITKSGIYQKSYPSQYGLDSIYQLVVTVNPSDTTRLHIQLCAGRTYNFNGRILSEPGVYIDTLTNRFFCDSLVMLRITRPETSETRIYETICKGGSLSIGGRDITKAGNYYDTVPNQFGCDSILHYIVTVQSYFFDETKTINKGETYVWHKNGQPWPLSVDSTYFDSCKTTVLDCDSIYRLQLIVNEAEYHFRLDTIICACDTPFIWQGHCFSRDTTYTMAGKTKLGLDSTYTLGLQVIHRTDKVEYISKCQGESAVIDGVTYTQPTTFTRTYKGMYGCDSAQVRYVLNFATRYSLTQIKELRNGDTYQFGDTLIRTSGIYFRNFKTVHGCDSMVTLMVTACPAIKGDTIHVNLCPGEEYDLDGEKITQSTTRTRLVKTKEGCDSMVVYQIRFDTPTHTTRNVSICPGGSYTWTGRIGHRQDTVLTDAGTYVDVETTGHGCFSSSTLNLNFKPNHVKDTIISVCRDKLPYEYGGKQYYKDSAFVQKLGVNQYGCDSILRWHYTVNHHCSKYDTYYRCSNEPKYIQGLIINKAGTYSVNRLTAQGEDSVYRFIVQDIQPYETFDSRTGCDAVEYNGQTILARGPGKETFSMDYRLKSVDGCDSIVHMTFTIGTSSPKHITYATIADYEKYRFEGRDYNVPGTYPIQHFNRYGCDSIEELQLAVLTTQYPDPVVYSFCAGDRTGMEIFGKLYYPTTDTLISDTIREGGQPIIRTAIVNKKLPFTITAFDPQTDQLICAANKVAFEVSYAVSDKGALPEYYEVDFMVGDLDIEPKHAVYSVNGKTVLPIWMDGKGTSVNPGYYSYRIKLGSDVCAFSDTTFTGSVLVRYPSEIMKANWSNVITLMEEDYNVGHWTLQAPYAWQVHNSVGEDKTALVVPSNSAQPYIASDNLRDGDIVIATLYRSDYNRPIPSCPFVFHPVQANNSQYPVLVYPTATAKSSAIHIETEQQGAYQLYDAMGNACQKGVIHQGDNMIHMPSVDGCYLIKINTHDGLESTTRVIVY